MVACDYNLSQSKGEKLSVLRASCNTLGRGSLWHHLYRGSNMQRYPGGCSLLPHNVTCTCKYTYTAPSHKPSLFWGFLLITCVITQASQQLTPVTVCQTGKPKIRVIQTAGRRMGKQGHKDLILYISSGPGLNL